MKAASLSSQERKRWHGIVERILNAHFCNCAVLGVEFEANEVHIIPDSCHTSRSAPHEWVKNDIAGLPNEPANVGHQRDRLHAWVIVLAGRRFLQ